MQFPENEVLLGSNDTITLSVKYLGESHINHVMEFALLLSLAGYQQSTNYTYEKILSLTFKKMG